MSQQVLRTFIAVVVPDQVKQVKQMLTSVTDMKRGKIRWVKNSGIHLTLKFLGHTPPDIIEAVNKTIAKVVNNHAPMKLYVKGTGCFPAPERPRVLWLGVHGDTEPLQELTQDLDRALERLGFPDEKREYTPHITVARIKYPQKWTPNVNAFLNSTYEKIAIPLNRVQFISSELYPDGPVYSILGTHSLTPVTRQEN